MNSLIANKVSTNTCLLLFILHTIFVSHCIQLIRQQLIARYSSPITICYSADNGDHQTTTGLFTSNIAQD